MRTLYYVEEKETEKEEKLNFEYVTDMKYLSVYEIHGSILDKLFSVRMLIEFDTEEELRLHIAHLKIMEEEEFKLIKL